MSCHFLFTCTIIPDMKKLSAYIFVLIFSLCFSQGIFAQELQTSTENTASTVETVDKSFFVEDTPTVDSEKEIIEVEKNTVQDESIPLEMNEQEIILEEKIQEDKAVQELLEKTIQDKIILKYKIQIDTIIDRLYDKIAPLSKQQQEQVLIEMQQKVLDKRPVIVSSQNIDPLRKEILVEIIDYIATSLDPNFLSIIQEDLRNR